MSVELPHTCSRLAQRPAPRQRLPFEDHELRLASALQRKGSGADHVGAGAERSSLDASPEAHAVLAGGPRLGSAHRPAVRRDLYDHELDESGWRGRTSGSSSGCRGRSAKSILATRRRGRHAGGRPEPAAGPEVLNCPLIRLTMRHLRPWRRLSIPPLAAVDPAGGVTLEPVGVAKRREAGEVAAEE